MRERKIYTHLSSQVGQKREDSHMGVYDSLLRVVSANKDFDFTIEDGIKVSRPFRSLCEGIPIDIGLDQSTAQIGFAVRNSTTKELLATMDICNLGFPDKYEFKVYFRQLLKLNLRGLNVKTFIYEIPVEHGGNMHVRRILNDLLTFVSELPKHIPELQYAEMIQVNNLVWKTHFLKAPEYKGLRKRTEDVKVSALRECLKFYPWVKMSQEFFSKPPDSCDAIGILYGTFEEMSSSFSEGIRKVNKVMPAHPRINYQHRVVSCRLSALRENVEKEFGTAEHMRVMEFNPTMDLDENCRRYVSNCKSIGALIVVAPKALDVLKWETGITVKDETENMFVFVRK